MDFFKTLMTPYFVNEECFKTLFLKMYLFDVPCLSSLVSKVLGYLIITGAVMVKLPQILKIVKSNSAIGVSFTSVCLELYAITSMLAYSIANSFPFSSWGDAFFLMIQVSFIGALVLYYKGQTKNAVMFLLGYSAILYTMLSGLTPISVLATLQASNMPAVLIAKVIQALECVRNGHTGQLSAITVFLTLLGSIARIFTSFQETGDNLIVTSYIVSSFANALVAFALLYYWNATNEYNRKLNLKVLDEEDKKKQ